MRTSPSFSRACIHLEPIRLIARLGGASWQMSHRSAPTLPFSTPPSYSHSYSRPARDPLRGLRPWSQPRTDEAGWTGARMSDASIRKQDTPIWRPPGPSEGHAIIRAHRRPPPPPQAIEPPVDDKSTELLADELRKSAAILAQAQAQMAEERQLSQMREREAQAQLSEAIELGRQEERQKAQLAVREANDSLSALAEANEQGAPAKGGKRAQKSGSKAVSRGVPRRSKRHGQHERVAVAEEEEDEEEADEEYGEAEADSE